MHQAAIGDDPVRQPRLPAAPLEALGQIIHGRELIGHAHLRIGGLSKAAG
jgi:hypothetical protein